VSLNPDATRGVVVRLDVAMAGASRDIAMGHPDPSAAVPLVVPADKDIARARRGRHDHGVRGRWWRWSLDRDWLRHADGDSRRLGANEAAAERCEERADE
jgi:hypothetical protein